jgi:BirA family biotin operon repressor/biotin-[acetyl-CoA-carboxylase] ligase
MWSDASNGPEPARVEQLSGSTGAQPIAVLRLQQIDSTSLFAKREAKAGRLCSHPMVFIARRQVSGVGRFGRRWESPFGGLWMTLCIPVPASFVSDPANAALGLRIGVACWRAIAKAAEASNRSLDIRLKWPNDIQIGGRKVLGVLTEIVHARTIDGERQAFVFIGVGVNANMGTADLAEDLRATATTLREELGREIDLNQLTTNLIAELVRAIDGAEPLAPVIGQARAHLAGVGAMQQVSLTDGTKITGVLRFLDELGAPIFEIDGQAWTPRTAGALPIVDMTQA